MAYEIPIALEYTHTHWPSPLLVLRIRQSIFISIYNPITLDILCVYKYCCISMCEHKALLIALDFINLTYTECIFLVCCFIGLFGTSCVLCVFEQERVCLFSVNISRPTQVSSHCFVFLNE